MKLITGAQALERIRRDLKTPSNVGRYSDENLRRFWQEEMDAAMEYLAGGDYGINQALATITGAGRSFALPADYLILRSLSRDFGDGVRVPGEYTSEKQLEGTGWLDTGASAGRRRWRFQIFTSATGDTLEVYPDLQAGETIHVTYATQPFDMGDPTNAAWDAVSVNVISESVYHYIVTRARLRAVSREDQREYQRAADAAAQKMEDYLSTRRGRQQAAGVGAGRSSNRRAGWIGY